jgi:uncharacterized membrane protein YeiH
MSSSGTLLQVVDLAGIFVFALSGAQAAARAKFDLVGGFTLGLVTSVGGGTLRALLIGDFPVPFLRSPAPVLLAATATLVVHLAYERIERLGHPIRLFDAFGLAFFLVTGTAASLSLGQSPWASALLGVTGAVAGGVGRDLLRRELPFVFQPGELYAVAALAGGVLLVLCLWAGVPMTASMLAGGACTLLLRLASIYFGWRTRPLSD